MTASPIDLIRAARLPERAVEVCLAGHLIADIERLTTELAEEKPRRQRRAAEKTDTKKLVEEIDALREQMKASTITVRVRALSRQDWRSLIDEHPPRKGNKGDADSGVNLDSFLEALLRKSIVDPKLEADDVDALFAALNGAEYERLTTAAWMLNRTGVAVPLSPRVSPDTETSDDA